MNKTVNISLNGIHFNIDDNAYHKLNNYLEKLEHSLGKDEGKEEIMQDVETRIAELFKQSLGISREVVSEADVNNMIATMGRPEQFLEETVISDTEEGEYQGTYYDSKGNANTYTKKLFRDPDEKIIGGVLAGISHYFGWNPVYLRAVILALPFLDFFGLLGISTMFVIFVYCLLWILIPVAVTNIDKLQMYGAPVNLDSIKKNVNRVEINETINRASNSAKDAAQRIGPVVETMASGFLKIFKIFFGIFLSFLGFSMSTGIIIFFFVVIFNRNFIPFQGMFFEHNWQYYMFVVFVVVSVLSLAAVLIYTGIRLLSSKRTFKNSGSFLISCFVLFIISVIGMSVIGFNTGSKFREEVSYSQKQNLDVTSDTLVVNFNENQNIIHFNNYRGISNVIGYSKNLDSLMFKVDRDVHIEKSFDNNYYLELTYLTRAENEFDGRKNLEQIHLGYHLNGNTLSIEKFFSLPKNEKFRDQSVEVTLYVPENKFVKISNVDNVSSENYDFYQNVYDRRSKEVTVKVSSNSIECTNCPKDKDQTTIDSSEDEVHIENPGGRIDINNDSVSIKGKNININIKDNSDDH